MEESYLDNIVEKLVAIDPVHSSKIKTHVATMDGEIMQKANVFYKAYLDYLESEGKSFDYSVDCYFKMVNDMINERLYFTRSGKYSSSSFKEIEERVYANPAIMKYHMHGLTIAQFAWYDQCERFAFFSNNLQKYGSKSHSYLEIGGGHGLYIKEATNLLQNTEIFDLVDISPSSIELTKGILADNRINYYVKDIFDFEGRVYDFITIGEVIEHVEDPLSLLKRMAEMLTLDGCCYVTTPINAPMIDHLYLFNNAQEIRDLLISAG